MAANASSIRQAFMLDPEITYLNHGAFGACPVPVFAVYQDWQRRLEREPVQFMQAVLMPALQRARQALGGYLKAEADDLVFITDATEGVNIIARSLKLKAGDEILTSDHEYGACDNVWDFVAAHSGARVVRQPVGLPLASEQAVVEALWSGVSRRTRLLFLSHITSPTALRFPAEELCRRARQAGILSIIDGAHAPGQIPLDLSTFAADVYIGNCHKWMMAPKGAGFLYARREVQPLIVPLTISWGWGSNNPFDSGSRFLDGLQWTGTRDPSAFLSVPAAMAFLEEHGWETVVDGCRVLLHQALERLQAELGLQILAPPGICSAPQMAALELPPLADPQELQARLFQSHRVEVPVAVWRGRPMLRLSIQGYNNASDIDALVAALKAELPASAV